MSLKMTPERRQLIQVISLLSTIIVEGNEEELREAVHAVRPLVENERLMGKYWDKAKQFEATARELRKTMEHLATTSGGRPSTN